MFGLLIVSCRQVDPNKHVDEGNVKENIYKSTEIGWSIKIPEGWTVVAKDIIEANDLKGKTAIEKTAGAEVDISRLKHLISFKKNQFNLFASTSEPYKEEYPGEYIENGKNLNKLIFDTYRDQGIKADSLSGIAIIDGLEFKTFETKIYGKDGTLILNQIMYSRLINGFDFGININYNNVTDRDEMLKALNESKFDKK
jgi:hypothetical protein